MSESTAIEPAQEQPRPVVRSMTMGKRGLALESFEDLYRFSKVINDSGLGPKGMDVPAIMVAIQMGAEVGLSPMAAIQNIAVINGRPGLWGDGMLAVCQGSGVFDHSAFEETVVDVGKGEMVASCTMRRLPGGKVRTTTFSMSDAKKAGLLGKAGPWTQYPSRMLQMRARSFCARDLFADILRGFDCAEDLRDIPVAAAAPIKVTQLDELADRVEERRSSASPSPLDAFELDAG